MPQQVQERINVRMKGLDDVFHNVMIALERLEAYLEVERKGESAALAKQTAVGTPRDLHDDGQNPPTKESILGEVQLQCSALFFQTQFDDDALFKRTMRYFMTDLLEWYGGRDKNTPYDEVEMYVLPIIVSLSRQADSVVDIMKTCDQYVVKLRRIEDFSDEEKEKAVEQGFSAFIRAQHHTGEQLQEFSESGADVKLTSHNRGSVEDGYKRLIWAMVNLYDEATPAKVVRNTFTTYVDGLIPVSDEQIAAQLEKKKVKHSPNPDTEKTEESDAPKNDIEKPKHDSFDKEDECEETGKENGISFGKKMRDFFFSPNNNK